MGSIRLSSARVVLSSGLTASIARSKSEKTTTLKEPVQDWELISKAGRGPGQTQCSGCKDDGPEHRGGALPDISPSA